MTDAVVIQAGEGASIVVIHKDGNMSEVRIEVDEHGLMNVWIKGDLTKPYSVIEWGIEEGS